MAATREYAYWQQQETTNIKKHGQFEVLVDPTRTRSMTNGEKWDVLWLPLNPISHKLQCVGAMPRRPVTSFRVPSRQTRPETALHYYGIYDIYIYIDTYSVCCILSDLHTMYIMYIIYLQCLCTLYVCTKCLRMRKVRVCIYIHIHGSPPF